MTRRKLTTAQAKKLETIIVKLEALQHEDIHEEIADLFQRAKDLLIRADNRGHDEI